MGSHPNHHAPRLIHRLGLAVSILSATTALLATSAPAEANRSQFIRQLVELAQSEAGQIALLRTAEGMELSRRILGRTVHQPSEIPGLVEQLRHVRGGPAVTEELYARLRFVTEFSIGQDGRVIEHELRRHASRLLGVGDEIGLAGKVPFIGRFRRPRVTFREPRPASDMFLYPGVDVGLEAHRRISWHSKYYWFRVLMNETEEGLALLQGVLRRPVLIRARSNVSQLTEALDRPENRLLLIDLDYRLGRILDAVDAIAPLELGLTAEQTALLHRFARQALGTVRTSEGIAFTEIRGSLPPRPARSAYYRLPLH